MRFAMSEVGAFERLASVLFDGDVRAADVKVVPGTGAGTGRDGLSQALLDSMERVGLVRDGRLVGIGADGRTGRSGA